MNYRLATILPLKSLGTKTTETIPILVKDPISRLDIAWRPTFMDKANLAALPVGIEKIELIDGSDVLHSLSGRENQAICIYDRRVPTMNHGMFVGGAELYCTMGIDFGRFLFDPELAFLPNLFTAPQLKITHDSTLLSANTSTHTLEVFAHLFDEKVISPIGFLMAKKHYAYVAATENATEAFLLPTDHVLRQVLLRGYHSQQDPTDVVDNFKLTEDGDKRTPIDCELRAYVNRMKGLWLPVQEVVMDYVDTVYGYAKYVTPTDRCTILSGSGNEGNTTNACWVDGGIEGGYIKRCGQVSAFHSGVVIGYLPHHCIQFPFGRQDQIDDWYDVTKLGSLKAETLSAGEYGAGSEISLITQQLRRY